MLKALMAYSHESSSCVARSRGPQSMQEDIRNAASRLERVPGRRRSVEVDQGVCATIRGVRAKQKVMIWRRAVAAALLKNLIEVWDGETQR